MNYDRVFYCPLANYNMYSVATKTLKKSASNGTVALKDSDITNHGKGVSQADGLAMDSAGLLYYGRLTNNTLAIWNTSFRFRGFVSDVGYRRSDKDMEWIDSLAFDTLDHIVFTTDKLNLYLAKSYNPNEFNFRIIRAPSVNQRKSYMYSANAIQ